MNIHSSKESYSMTIRIVYLCNLAHISIIFCRDFVNICHRSTGTMVVISYINILLESCISISCSIM